MALSAEEAASVEAAFEAAQARTRAPLVCVLAAASSDYAFVPALWSGLLAPGDAVAAADFRRGFPPERIFLVQLVVLPGRDGGPFAAAAAGVADFPRAARRANATAPRSFNIPCAGSIAPPIATAC